MDTTHPLRRLRKDRSLTQTQLAEMAGVSQQTIARIEADARLVYGTSLLKLSNALGVPVTEIAGPNQLELARLIDYRADRPTGGWLTQEVTA